MVHVSINDLPKYSPWPNRLLGEEDFKKVVRTEAKVREEYDNDKYAKLLEHLNSFRKQNVF